MSEDATFLNNFQEGMNKFQSARFRAFWKEMINHLRGKPAELLSFEDIRARLRLREESYRGLKDVPLEKIVGSVGRYRDFTRDFLPRSNKMQERWSRVYAATSSMEGLQPIELYKIGEVYFVRDGNHRVSVARQLDARTIQAHVTELPTSINLHPGISEEELLEAAAYAAFLEETALARTRPHHVSMELTETSRYADLLGHIYIHKEILEQIQEVTIPLAEAAAQWYDTVYRPAVTLIRKYGIMDQIKDRTEGDLYLWLVDHLHEVRERFGKEAPARKFSHALVDFLAERSIPIPKDLLIENDDSVILSRTQVMRAVNKRIANEATEADEEATENDEKPPVTFPQNGST